MHVVTNDASALTETDKETMFQMYENSYRGGGQELWFRSKEELFNRYPCFLSVDNNYLVVYAMFQMKNKYNKISLICHNGSVEGKELSIQLCLELIKRPGWMLEASDKVSWLLRKQNAPIISSHEEIVNALDIKDNPNDIIHMNASFNYGEKLTYQYVRSYTDPKTDEIFHSPETLFGTAPCNYADKSCSRSCPTRLTWTSGKSASRRNSKTKTRNRKTKKARRK
jgi:hypothetical protein